MQVIHSRLRLAGHRTTQRSQEKSATRNRRRYRAVRKTPQSGRRLAYPLQQNWGAAIPPRSLSRRGGRAAVRVLLCPVVADDAAGDRTEHAVVAGVMARDPTHQGTLDAALGIGRRRRKEHCHGGHGAS